MISCGASYHNCIHSVMSVIDPLLVKSSLQFERHHWNFMAVDVLIREIRRSGQLIHTSKTGEYYSIPNIVNPPIFLKPVCNSPGTRYHVFGDGLLFVFFPDNIR